MALIEREGHIVAFGDRELDLANAALRELAVSPIQQASVQSSTVCSVWRAAYASEA